MEAFNDPSLKTVDDINMKVVSLLQKGDSVIFGGSTTMDKATFKKHIMPPLDVAIKNNTEIRVGCATGCDLEVQQQCDARGYYNVTVYIPEDRKDDANIESEKFNTIIVKGGFKERDAAMQVGCYSFVGVLSQYAGAASGTAANIISMVAKTGYFGTTLDGYKVVKVLRRYLLDFDPTMQKMVAETESKK